MSNKSKAELIKQEGDGELQFPKSATKEDERLVEGVVGQIRDILKKTVAHGMEEIGKLLLREFYDDDPELYRATSPTKHVSLRLLLDRAETMELPVRRTFLANALQMVAFSRGLPASSPFLQLPPSHRVELLRLRTPDKVETIAAAAVEKQLAVRKIREVVRKEREKTKSTRGRKPVPEVLRALRTCVKLLRDQDTGRLAFKREHVDGLTDEQKEAAAGLAEVLGKRVEDLGKLLG